MNKSKVIILVVAVAVAVAVGVIIGFSKIGKPKSIVLPKNQFTAKVEAEIDTLKELPDNKFCKNFYKEIVYHINDYYQQNRFSEDTLENEQWKENLDKMLYSVYVEKFINQAKAVFNGSVWREDDLNFIQKEKNELKKSVWLSAGSPVDKELSAIQTVLNKYNEIKAFISQCTNYSYSGMELSDRFPVSDVQRKIQRAADLQSHDLENAYVNNCTRLHTGLKDVSRVLFKAHVRYLDNKIDYWSGKYSNYSLQSEYSTQLYTPLLNEIKALDNDIYNVNNFDSEYNRLIQKLRDDSNNAYRYFSN